MRRAMGALCDGRPAPGADCNSPRAGGFDVPGRFGSLISALRSRGVGAVAAGGSVLGTRALGRREANAVRAANTYMSARISGRNKDVLRLVTDDVRLTSSRDGVVQGKKGFADYLERVKASGKWNAASWDAVKKRAEVRGLVRIVFVNVNVIAHFRFDRHGRINDIYVGTKR